MKKSLYAPKYFSALFFPKCSQKPILGRFPAFAIVTACGAITKRYDIPWDSTWTVGRSERYPVVRNKNPEQAGLSSTDRTTGVPVIERITPCSLGIRIWQGTNPSTTTMFVDGSEVLLMKAALFRAQLLPVGLNGSTLCDTGKEDWISRIESQDAARLL